MMDDEFARVSEAAKALKVNSRRVHLWIASGKVPGAIRDPGGLWLVPRAWIRDKLAQRSHGLGEVAEVLGKIARHRERD